MISKEENRVYEVFDLLSIPYMQYRHEAIFTIEEANNLDIDIPGGHCKNIFICDNKKRVFLLVVLPDNKPVNFKLLSETLGYKGLRFAPEEMLQKYLGLMPGSVTPFGLINDNEKKVEVVIDTDIFCKKLVGFHPNVNTVTVTLTGEDFKRFLTWCGNITHYIKI